MFMIIYFLFKHQNLNFKYKVIDRKIDMRKLGRMDMRIVGWLEGWMMYE